MGRLLRIGASCALALVFVTCTEQTLTGPHGTGMAVLNFSALAPHEDGLPVPVESLEVRLQRPTEEFFALDSVFALDRNTTGDDSAVIKLNVVLRQSPEDFLLSVRAFGGGITWYTASSPITIAAGAKAVPLELVVQYVGPGANAARIVIAPTDTTVVGGIPFPLRAVVFNNGQAPIPGVPVGYRVSDTSLAFVTQLTPHSATFTGKPGVRDSVWVVAETPTHLKDSTRVHIIPAIPVGTVTILPKVDTIPNGASLQYTAVALDALGNPLSRAFAWTSTNPSVATVSSTGLATARGGDSTLIIVSAGGVADTARLYVRALQSITLSPSDISIDAIGDIVDLTTSVVYNFDTVVPDYAVPQARAGRRAGIVGTSGSNIRFASASPSVATVDRATGQVTIISTGDAVIVAHDSVASSDSLVQGFATLHVKQVTAGIHNSPKSPVTIGVGGREQLTATAVDANGYPISGKTFSWVALPDSTTGAQIVSVTTSGLVTGVAVGTTHVISQLSDGQSSFQDVTDVVVSDNPPTELRWAFDKVTVAKGGSVWVGLSITTPAPGPLTIEIKSDDDRIAQPRLTSVTIPGGESTTLVEIDGLSIGHAIITAKDGGGSGKSYSDAVLIVDVGSTDLPSLILNSDISLDLGKPARTFVSIPYPVETDITVSLTGVLVDVPKTVTIIKGDTIAYFDVTSLLPGLAIWYATAPGFLGASVSIQVPILGGF